VSLSPARARTWLLAGLPGSERAASIKAFLHRLQPSATVSVLLEGQAAAIDAEIPAAPGRHVHVLAPGCLCCSGNLTLRVTLARVLRLEKPQYLIIAIADVRHEARMAAMLRAAPWDLWLRMVNSGDDAGTA